MTVGPSGERIAHWLGRLVQIPSVNPLQAGPSCGVSGEQALATALADWFGVLGAEVELDEALPGRPNVYAVFEGHREQVVVLDVHLDTVTVENMTDPPFDGRIADGCVWGRGALDTKASLGVALAMAESWRADGLRPDPTLVVVGSIGEEAGGFPGAVAFRRWALGRGLDATQTLVAEPTGLRAVHGHKGVLGMRVVVHGTSAHSATPDEGRNAVFAAARAVVALERHAEELAAVPPATPMGAATLLVSTIDGGIASNVVPDRCEFTVDRRLIPGEDPRVEFDRLTELIRTACPLPVTITSLLPDGLPGAAAFYTPAESRFVTTLSVAAGTTPTTAPFGTNALMYDGFGGDKVVFGPGRIEDAHKPTEAVSLADLRRTAEVYAAWLRPH